MGDNVPDDSCPRKTTQNFRIEPRISEAIFENSLFDGHSSKSGTLSTKDLGKCFSQRCPLKDLRSMLLTIPLTTMNLTQDVITKALETVRGADLSQWINDVFGQSMLSKRQTLFAAVNGDIKTV